jgi:hypothetical protein
MIIGSDRKLCNISSISVSVNNTEVSNAQGRATWWSEHIDRISAKVNQRLGLLRRITGGLILPCVINPRADGAKRRARVLFPHGYLHPGKRKH